jgi:hypothetical protein
VTTEHFECPFLSCVKIRDAVTHGSYLLCYWLPNEVEDTPNKFLIVAPIKVKNPTSPERETGSSIQSITSSIKGYQGRTLVQAWVALQKTA